MPDAKGPGNPCPGRGARSLPSNRREEPRAAGAQRLRGIRERSRPQPAESHAGAPIGAEPAQTRSDGYGADGAARTEDGEAAMAAARAGVHQERIRLT